jgi:hypothetical protein
MLRSLSKTIAPGIAWAVAASFALSFGAASAGELNPAAISITLPKDIKWIDNTAAGSRQAVLVGDPSKPGLYIVLNQWTPHHMSHPHFHVNDRYITVLSGTWWVGTGTKWDPEMTTPIPAGSYVRHVGKEIHWDGAKDETVTLEIVGMGPATSIPADQK